MLTGLKKIFIKNKPLSPKILSIGDPYRVNRIIRSEWNTGNCKQLNQFHHYAVCIDGENRRFGILEILGAIEALEEHETKSRLKKNN